MEKIKRIHPAIKNNIRYKLVQKMMDDQLINWFNQPSTIILIDKLLKDCKKKATNFSAPSPLFMNKLNNSLINSNPTGSQFIPPVNPNSASIQNFNSDKRNLMSESTIINNEEKKKLTESLTNSMLTSMKLSKIPKFYFPEGSVNKDTMEYENNYINEVFGKKDELTIDEFLPFTRDFYQFPPLYNRVLFNKIDTAKSGKISKTQFTTFHNDNFRGMSSVKRYFNFIKSPQRKEIIPEDFKPFIDCLLDFNKSLDFLKVYPTYQKKYSEVVIFRIFYKNDTNDDGKLSLREFKKSNLIDILAKVADNDINNIREYFSYEHFYVIYCIFYELNNDHDPEVETCITREQFAKYNSHALGDKVVDRIFNEVPRKLKSKEKNKMTFEDFLYYLLCEEDKTNTTSIKYWFTILDLDDNGIVTPSEMEYFYEEQMKRIQSTDIEVIKFSDVLCQLCDLIPKEKQQWTIKDFIDHPDVASVLFNSLFNFKKFMDNEEKDIFSKTEIDKNPEYTDWDRFAYYEYLKRMAEEGADGEEQLSNRDNEEISNVDNEDISNEGNDTGIESKGEE